ncbi:MAG: DUF3567 family protein [Proteobacteria bacterium]|jgi:hypothetical protein|nr:DUF3567 family protein [Pseudomonadota bacterium]NBS57025.1 DUF3567 family protein [Betaproteobacteria bacterium]
MSEMNVLYDSPQFYMAEFSGSEGIELVDKSTGRGGYLEGDVAHKLRASLEHLFSDDPSVESVDEFLGHYEALLTNRIVLH